MTNHKKTLEGGEVMEEKREKRLSLKELESQPGQNRDFLDAIAYEIAGVYFEKIMGGEALPPLSEEEVIALRRLINRYAEYMRCFL